MKVIDLLNKIANGEEVPEKIKTASGITYKYNYDYKNYTVENDFEASLFDDCIGCYVNAEVEILEDKTEKIEEINKNYGIFGFDDKSFGEMKEMVQDLYEKINELVRAINKLNKKDTSKDENCMSD